MKRRRVKITGIGFVTPAGVGKEAFQAGILENRSHVHPIKRFPEDAGAFVGSEVKKFNIAEFFDNHGTKRMPRHTQFALAAAKLAIEDAKLTRSVAGALDPVVVTGTSLMDSGVINKTIEDVTRKGPRFGLTRVVFQGPVASIAAAVAQYIGAGRTLSLQSACCSGADAIGHAAAMIANGETDLAICGGTEAPLYYHPMLELKMAELSPATSERADQLNRPFDLWRTTGVIGEGACMMILEPDSSPRSGYAEVAGYSFATDSGKRAGDGLHAAIRLCLANAGVSPGQVDMISAWGPGHRELDAVEAAVLREIFGECLDRIPTVSIKGAIGNPFAAAGAIQIGCAALGIQQSFIPPTVNWRHADPACRLNLSSQARYLQFSFALINSHGLSGTNAAILLRRCDATMVRT
ncbi:MAG: beta-ketoacyl synthase N-terminal-like domain-containing protein [Opitutaceae bacterium]|nr:beta-ketoacyl synthase N-terminal-like domain-containing protein [Opitutaceae bacterium]